MIVPPRIVSGVSEFAVDAAARIWAQATAARDDDPDVAPLELARPVIACALDESANAVLLTAWSVEQQAVGFALALPSAGEAELRFLGVLPRAWGSGVATALIDELASELRSRDCSTVDLWVYNDNKRAIGVYERSGWQHDATRIHPDPESSNATTS